MKARLTMLVALAAVVVATLALAGVAWAQQAPAEGDVGTQVVGGTKVPDGKYPFMASLQADTSRRPPSIEHFCGGTLIDRDSVLTAGHCVEFIGNTTDQNTLSFRDVRIVVGVTALDSGQGQARRIARLSDISIHPSFDVRRSAAYDAAVIDLARPVKGIKPIGLARVGSDAFEDPGRRATVTGWGSVRAAAPDDPPPPLRAFPNRMREARVPIVSDQRCERAYDDPSVSRVFRVLPELMVCAGAERLGTCVGDSGGPLFVRAAAQRGGQIGYRQIGIVSFGAGCATGEFPGVYTEVNAPSIPSFISSAASG